MNSIVFACFLTAIQLPFSFSNDDVAAAGLPVDEFGDYNGSDLISWVKSHPQGIVHPSIRIGREVPGDKSTLIGLFAASNSNTEPIEKGEIIAQIPWDLMIHPGKKYGMESFFSCRSIKNLKKELELGEKSSRAPYVRYLLTQNLDNMPGYWSDPALDFLGFVLGDDELPPFEDKWKTDYIRNWITYCKGDPRIDPLEKQAFYLISSRDEDSLMVPIYDMANHSNDPKKLNTLSYKPTSPGDYFQFVASRKIMPGEQIYNSYNRCNQCSDVEWDLCETFSWNRTPDLFAEFGFVEDYPQTWRFDREIKDSSDDEGSGIVEESEMSFCLEKNDETGELEVAWDADTDDDLPDDDDIEYLAEQLTRLGEIRNKKDDLEKKFVEGGNDDDESSSQEIESFGEELKISGKMKPHEWEAIWMYLDSLTIALGAAIVSVSDVVGLHQEDLDRIIELSKLSGIVAHDEL